MDQNTLVEGGDKGLLTIAEAFKNEGFPVAAIYLAKRTSIDGYMEWVVPVVLSPFPHADRRRFIDVLVQLRRAKKLPFIDRSVRIDAVPPDHVEASRIIAYANQLGDLPLVIRDVLLDGVFIEYALVPNYLNLKVLAA